MSGGYMWEKYGLGYTFAHVPDLQTMTKYYPADLTSQFTQLAANGPGRGVGIVVCSGDLTDTAGDATEMARVSAAFDLLDAVNMPYLVTVGNHDAATDSREYTEFQSKFPQSRFTSKTWWNGGFCTAGESQNAYCIIGGTLFMVLEFGPRQAAIDWANTILTANSSRQAILTTHSFMFRDGTRCGTGDQYNPHDYITSDVHDGEEMWTELVKLHDNIIMVCCGHDINGDTTIGTVAKRADNSDGGQSINQVMCNWQEVHPTGHFPYTRFYKILPKGRTIKATTQAEGYAALYDAANQFELSY